MVKKGDLYDILLLLEQYDVFGRMRLQKLLYLLQQEGGVKLSYAFVPHYYGPYSHELADDVGMLEALGLVESVGENPCIFRLTKKGKTFIANAPNDRRKNKENIRRFLGEHADKDTEVLVSRSKDLMRKKLGYDPW